MKAAGPPSSVDVLVVVPGAKAYIAALQAALPRQGGRLLRQASAEALLQESGRVTGVRANVARMSRSFTARRGVILAAGDYANSPETITRYKGLTIGRLAGQHAAQTLPGTIRPPRALTGMMLAL